MALSEPMSDAPAEQPQQTEEALVGDEKPAEESREDGKMDSEAETEILSGGEDRRIHVSKKVIKLEDAESVNTGAGSVRDQTEQKLQNSGNKHSLKRKRGSDQPPASDGNDDPDSSKLSSTVSSPVIGRRTSDDVDRESESSPPIENENRQRDNKSHKRADKILDLESEKSRKGQGESSKESALSARKRRDTRSGTDFDESAHRSTSPSSRSVNRAHSIHSGTSQHQGGKKRKKAPTPLHVEHRNRPSEDVHESDSSSGESHQPTKTRSEAREGSMTWKPNKVSKTNKDRSGRTRLARACATGIAEDVEKWLDEREEDIDVADFAGNTPLQVASLEGHADIVKLLLEAGCATDSRNVDGDTPLIDAVENGHLEVVQLLLDAGVDPMQRSQNGKEPIELVKSDMDDAEEIRAALLASKKDKDGRRRQSEDQSRSKMSAPRELEISSTANSGPSPTHSTRSPPLEPGTKRRTARSQHTDDNLLWVNPTPQRLRDAAGKGDIKIVNHILGMNPRADTDAILAAAQGGHDEVLGLMLAMGDPEPDPPPLRSGSFKAGYTTPMLAAIGGGNLKVLELLVHQPGFDPTRRIHKNLTYYELAKERQGSGWEEEYGLLKDAHEQFKKNGGRRSNHTSPNKVRAKRNESRKSSPEPSSSPYEVRKIRRPQLAVKEENEEQPNPAPKRRPSYQGTASRRPEEFRKMASILSDQEAPRQSKPRDTKLTSRHRSTSPSQSLPKQRRRLMSGNEVKTDQDSKRSKIQPTDDKEGRQPGDSVNSHDAKPRKYSEVSVMSAPPTKKASSESPHRTKEELGRKRHRTSVSPQANRSETADALKKKKRQRVDSHGNGTERTLGAGRLSREKASEVTRDRSTRLGPAPAANMLSTASTKLSPKPTAVPVPTAPVAFMGGATVLSATESPTKESPVEADAKTISPSSTAGIARSNDDLLKQSDNGAHTADDNEKELLQQEEQRQQQERLEEQETARKEAETREKVEAERQAQIKREREEADRKTREIERLAQEEKEAEAKRCKEEELQKKRLEQDRLRKLEQEKRIRDQKVREAAARVRIQQEEEAKRRAALPNGLRRYLQLNPDQARSALEFRKWLPLRTVSTEDLDDDNAKTVGAPERWIANIQAAMLLANRDLELSQCEFCPSLTEVDCRGIFSYYLTLSRYSMVKTSCNHSPATQSLETISQSYGASPSKCLRFRCRSSCSRSRDPTEVPQSEYLLD